MHHPISELMFWDHSKMTGKCSKGAGARANYAKILLKNVGYSIPDLFTTDSARRRY